MRIFSAIDAAASGMTAERFRMDVISNNMANVNSTRTAEGGPYRRQQVVYQPREDTAFANAFEKALNKTAGNGVKVVGVEKDMSPLKKVYEPNHPDADKEGYVNMPNVNIITEMVDMMMATRAYEANAAVVNAAKSMAAKALEIGK